MSLYSKEIRDNIHSSDTVNCDFIKVFKINSMSDVKVEQKQSAEL